MAVTVRALATNQLTQSNTMRSIVREIRISLLNGVTIALLSMLGEYVVRTLNTVSAAEPYHVRQRVTAG